MLLIEANPGLSAPYHMQMQVSADAGDLYVVASGGADLACRITQIDRSIFT